MKESILKKILSALAGLVLCSAVGAALGTWGLPEEPDLLTAAGPIRITVSGVGAALSLLTVLMFANIRLGGRERTEGEGPNHPLLDGLGFGLLPGITVWKLFEQGTRLGRGVPLPEGIPAMAWITEGGVWMPSRLEAGLALGLFAAVVIWLMLRKKELPANGDLAGVSVTLWCAGRLVTEGTRALLPGIGGMPPVNGWLAAALMLLYLILWTARAVRASRHPGYAVSCGAVWTLSVAGIIMIRNEILTLNHPVAKIILVCAASALAMKAVLCMGRISRS